MYNIYEAFKQIPREDNESILKSVANDVNSYLIHAWFAESDEDITKVADELKQISTDEELASSLDENSIQWLNVLNGVSSAYTGLISCKNMLDSIEDLVKESSKDKPYDEIVSMLYDKQASGLYSHVPLRVMRDEISFNSEDLIVDTINDLAKSNCLVISGEGRDIYLALSDYGKLYVSNYSKLLTSN